MTIDELLAAGRISDCIRALRDIVVQQNREIERLKKDLDKVWRDSVRNGEPARY